MSSKSPQSPACSKRWLHLTVALLLLTHGALLAYSAKVHSPTYNEPGHLVAGLSYWEFGRFDVYKVNPPLVRMVAAAPVILAGYEKDWHGFFTGPGARPEMSMGADLFRANQERSFWLLTLARWACIPFSMLGGWICFRWGCDLYGDSGGLIALGLWCFCPNLLGHGPLITSDAAAAALGIAACYCFWLWLRKPTWWNCVLSGTVLGIAELAKTTLVIFYPLWPLLWLVDRWCDRRQMTKGVWGRELLMLVARMAVGLYVINMGYGFEGTGTPLGKFQFVSDAIGGPSEAGTNSRLGRNRFADSWLGSLPVPLPANYVLGIDLQRKDFERYGSKFYLVGEWSDKGWWYYYLYWLGVKLPVGTLLLLALALVPRLSRGHAKFRDEFYLLFPGVVILAFVSSQTGMNEHGRYVLPVLPYFYIWAGRTAQIGWQASPVWKHSLRGLVMAGLLWSIGSSLYRFPNSLSYFNELVGGPQQGWRYFTHSNIDWGQDLFAVRQWQMSHPDRLPLTVSALSIVRPNLFGFEMEHFRKPYEENNQNLTVAAGWYTVGTTDLLQMLHEHPELATVFDPTLAVERITDSYFVFHVPSATQLSL